MQKNSFMVYLIKLLRKKMANNLVLTPAAVNKYIKSLLEGDKYLKRFDIEGEISNFKSHSNGNFYFSIKDNEAQINCVMFKSYANNINFVPSEGAKVIMSGTIYENIKTGFYSINVRKMEEEGIGDLAKEFSELKQRLQNEGLFDENHKQVIKKNYQTVGVVTSPTSAVIQDIIITIKRRNPLTKIIIFPTLVQGKKAAENIVKNINRANELNLVDVLIVGRGGGSIEELWSFNEEEVAKAVFASKIPIVSSVGHETDTTIIDFVSDLRAPTPTAAAELVTFDLMNMQNQTKSRVIQISKIIEDKINYKKVQLQNLTQNQYLINPFIQKRINFDFINQQLITGTNRLNERFKLHHEQLGYKDNQLRTNVDKKLINSKTKLTNIHKQLDNLNPLAILSRGFSVVRSNDQIISSIEDIVVDSLLTIKVLDGEINSKVISKEKNE